MTGDAGDMWVFGYGSLMWRPDFPFLERVQATIGGHHRAFCIASTLHRGTPSRPGLVLGLDRGGSCQGVAYRVAAKDAQEVLAYLRARELIYGVYREQTLPAVVIGDGASSRRLNVLAYTVERCHPSYMGRLPFHQAVRLIRGAKGQSGANLDYLINTVRHLQALGIRERVLERLMAICGAHAAHWPQETMNRPSAAGIRAVSARLPAPDIRVAKGDQRRFGHRVRIG